METAPNRGRRFRTKRETAPNREKAPNREGRRRLRTERVRVRTERETLPERERTPNRERDASKQRGREGEGS